MPILLIFTLTAACLPIDWPASPLGLGRAESAALTGFAVATALMLAFALRTWVVRALRDGPGRRADAVRVYARGRRVLFFLNLGVVALCVFGLGWGHTVQHTLALDHVAPPADAGDADLWPAHRPRLAPFAELAVPLPYFAILLGCWLTYFDAERALHRAATAAAGRDRAFWSRAGYAWNQARQFAVLVMFPVALFATSQTVARWLPAVANSDAYRVGMFAVVPVVVLIMPRVLKPTLGLKPLPPGPTRDRLEALARRLRFRYSDLLVWPTHGATANALIVGLVPWVRYVVFTDRMLDEFADDEIDGVFGHEVGHAHHGHIWYYLLFLSLSAGVLMAGLLCGGQAVAAAAERNPGAWYARVPEGAASWLLLVPLAAMMSYIFVAFGFLSRRCERQADVYGCRALSCDNPGCERHDDATHYPDRAAGLCPTGCRAFARALDRVAEANDLAGVRWREPNPVRRVAKAAGAWLRAWQHGPMPVRVEFVLSLAENPARERRFQRRLRALRWGVLVVLVAALVALGQAVGWRTLWLAL